MGKVSTGKSQQAPVPVPTDIPRGLPKSGRIWKSQKKRASSVKNHKRDSFQKKQELRQQKMSIKEQSRAIVEQKKLEQQLKRERETANKKRKEENARKSEIVQVIRKTSKLKKMKKKQLRLVETRDTTVVEKA